MKSWHRNYQAPALQTYAVSTQQNAEQKAYEEGRQTEVKADLSVVSYERALYGALSQMAPRLNLDDLVGKKGLKIYKQMRTDEQVKAVCVFKRDAILSRGWTFEYDKESKLPDKEREQRVRVFEKIIEKMPGSFIDSLNIISTGREYGFSLTEKVYAVIECDGKNYIGLNSLRGREPWSFEFYVDPWGDLDRCEQLAGGSRIQVDLSKFIHYVHNPEFDIYFGQSDLREAYRSWYHKDACLKYWGFYMEKLGGGMLVGKLTQDSTITYGSTEYNTLTRILQSVKATGSVLMPKGVELEAVFPQNSDSFDKALGWHDLAIAKALLVPNLLGVSNNGGVGSYAQSQTQLDAFAWTVKADTDRLESCLNEQLFKDLGDQNWNDGEYPVLKFKPPDTEKLKWIMETFSKFLGQGAIVATEDDEKRLREILGMPPRNPDSVILASAQAEEEEGMAEKGKQKDFERQEKGKDNDKERNFQDDKRRALDPVLGQQEKEVKEKKKAEFAAMLREFGFNPDQERDKNGQWTKDGTTEAMQDHLEREFDGAVHGAQKLPREIADEVMDAVSSTKLSKSMSPRAQNALRAVLNGMKNNTGDERLRGKDRSEAGRGLWGLAGLPDPRPAAPRDARLPRARARARVDFKVIDHSQSVFSSRLSSEWSKIVVTGVTMMLGDDENLKKLLDDDTSDIGMIEFSGVTKGRLKKTGMMELREAWGLGRRHAEQEIRRTGHRRKTKDMAHFANLRKTAEEYFENNAFRMASNVSDGVRALIQLELQNAVKYGKSPPQTRESIWDRLTSKGFASRDDVRETETDQGVIQALDALWVDDEDEAKHYLDTLARTNLFEAMNEARFGEFQDPALDGFVVALRYSAILDDRTTHICEGLDDRVYKTNSELWDRYRPPNHFNCRSLLIPITQVDVQAGEWDGEESEEPSVEPQEGFK